MCLRAEQSGMRMDPSQIARTKTYRQGGILMDPQLRSVGGIVGLLVAVPSYTVLRVFAKEFFSEVSLVRKLTKEI